MPHCAYFFTEGRGVYTNILSGPPPPAGGPMMAPDDSVILQGSGSPVPPPSGSARGRVLSVLPVNCSEEIT